MDSILKKGDCYKLLKTLPDKSIDLILTDPPYNLSQYSTGNLKFANRADLNNDIAHWDKQSLNIPLLKKSLKEC